MLQPLVKVLILHKCRVHDQHQKPGAVVEVSESDAKLLVGMGKASLDLKTEVKVKKEGAK